MGLHTASHLQQFLSSGLCEQQALVCHDPSGVWLPLWLVLQVCSLMPAQQRQHTPSPVVARDQQHQGMQSPAPGQQQGLPNSSPGPAQQQQWQQHQHQQGQQQGQHRHHGSQASTQHQQQQTQTQQQVPSAQQKGGGIGGAGRRAATSSSKQSSEEEDEYGYGVSSNWLRKVKAVEAAAKAKQQQARQQQEKQQQQQQQATQQQQQQGREQQQDGQAQASVQGADGWGDADMQDAAAAVLAAVSELRGDQSYLDELSRAVEMDWEVTLSPTSEPAPAAAAAGSDGSSGTYNAVDLADLAAASSAASGSLSTQELVLVLVLDTNVLLEPSFLRLLHQLQGLPRSSGHLLLQLPVPDPHATSSGTSTALSGSSGGCQAAAVQVQFVVPWTVLVELDRLKLKPHLEFRAREAVEVLQRELVAPHSCSTGQVQEAPLFAVQSLKEFRQAALDFNPGVPEGSLSADDRIMQCALSQQKLQHAGLPEAGAGAGQTVHRGVLLLTSDKVLQLKAQANALRVAGLRDLPLSEVSSSSAHANQQAAAAGAVQLQPPLPALVQMLQLAGVRPAWLQGLGASWANALPQHFSGAPAHTLLNYSMSNSSSRSPAHSEAAPGSPSYSQKAAQMATLAQQLQQDQLTRSQPRAAASSFLTFLRITLSTTVLGWFQLELEEHYRDVLVKQPPWSDVDFLDVLTHHWNSTIKAHLVASQQHKAAHLKSTLDFLFTMAKRLHSQNFRDINLHTLPSNLGVRVLEVLQGFGAEDAAQQVEAALSAATAAATAAASAAGSHADTAGGRNTAAPAAAPGSLSVMPSQAGGQTQQTAAVMLLAVVPNMHAQLQAAAAAAAAAALTTGSVGTTAASFPPAEAAQRQQQQQQQGPFQGTQPALAAALAEAAAAVAAPQLHGPCLFLSQLLVYVLSLLHAVLPQLSHHLLTPGNPQAANALSVGAAYAARLQAAVQQLEALGQHIDRQRQRRQAHLQRPTLTQHDQDMQQQQWQQLVQGEVLQLGLLLVQLCSLILQNEAAGVAVSQQIMMHSSEFASEAVVYLSSGQQQAGQSTGPAAMLQQLSAVLQHLQLSLRQARGA